MRFRYVTKGQCVTFALVIALLCGGVWTMAEFSSGMDEKYRHVRGNFRQWPPCPDFPDPKLNC
jgi:hypothetical protein